MRGKKEKRARPDANKRAKSRAAMVAYTQAIQVKVEEGIELYAPLLPGRVGSDLSFIEFADEIEPSVVQNMTTCLYLHPSTCCGLLWLTRFLC